MLVQRYRGQRERPRTIDKDATPVWRDLESFGFRDVRLRRLGQRQVLDLVPDRMIDISGVLRLRRSAGYRACFIELDSQNRESSASPHPSYQGRITREHPDSEEPGVRPAIEERSVVIAPRVGLSDQPQNVIPIGGFFFHLRQRGITKARALTRAATKRNGHAAGNDEDYGDCQKAASWHARPTQAARICPRHVGQIDLRQIHWAGENMPPFWSGDCEDDLARAPDRFGRPPGRPAPAPAAHCASPPQVRQSMP
jgi:hypothetical protein